MAKKSKQQPESHPNAWQSKIVGHDRVAPDQLVANPLNYRKHPQAQRDALKAAIEEVGFIRSVTVNKRTGNLIDGHERVWQALTSEQPFIDVEYVDLSEADERKALATLDPISEMAEVDAEQLDQLLREVETGSEALQQLFSELVATNGVEELLEDEVCEVPVPAVPDDPVTKLGDLWILGGHRLLCGDSRDMVLLDRLLDGRLCDMCFTDPPYNVAYTGKTKDALTIANDSMGGEEFLQFLRDAFVSIAYAIKPGSLVYVCHADSEGMRFRQAFEESGLLLKQCLIWVKNCLVLGRQDYQWRHEPILYGWKPGAPHRFKGNRKQTTVIDGSDGISFEECGTGVRITMFVNGRSVVVDVPEYTVVLDGTDEQESTWLIDKPSRSSDHPTMKPVRLCARAIKHGTVKGEAVLDTFCGSGSTLIAAEQLRRSCYAMELSPKYCDVIVQRWETLTGHKATLG